MIQSRKSIHGQHAEGRRKPGPKNRPLVRGNHKGRPGVIRAPGDVERIAPDRDPGFHAEHGAAAQDAAKQANQRHIVAVKADRFGGFFDRIGRVAIHAAIAGSIGGSRGHHQFGRRVELGQQSVSTFWYRHQSPASCTASDSGLTFAWGSIMRISDIGIMGSKRMKRKNRVVKRPSVPMKVA